VALRRPATVRTLSPLEAAWFGGLFEGEGSIPQHGERRKRSGAITLELSSTEIETIATVLRLVGAGSIDYIPAERFARRGLPHRKDQWRWRLHGRENCDSILRTILPFLTGKRERAISCLQMPLPYWGTPRKEYCFRGHLLAENRYISPGGSFGCRACAIIRMRAHRERKKREVSP